MSVAVVPYDPAWPTRFDQERRLLERVLAPWLDGGIHHIGAHHFDKRDGEATTHGLHLTELGSELWRERLACRDALRRDEALAREYEALKLTVAEQHNAGLVEYTAGKRAFVAQVLEAAGIELRRV